MSSWKTTAMGICAVIAAIVGVVPLLMDGDPSTNPDWTAVIAAVVAGIGLISARDNDKTSEDAGVQ